MGFYQVHPTTQRAAPPPHRGGGAHLKALVQSTNALPGGGVARNSPFLTFFIYHIPKGDMINKKCGNGVLEGELRVGLLVGILDCIVTNTLYVFVHNNNI